MLITNLTTDESIIKYFKITRWSGIINRTLYAHRQKSTKSYFERGTKLLLTKDEFNKFCDNNSKKIINLYRDSKGKRSLVPTLDRINNNGDYSLENIRIISHAENNINRTPKTKPIVGIHIKTGEKIYFLGYRTKEFNKAGFNSGTVGSICNQSKNKGYRSKGYYWFFQDDPRLKTFSINDNKNALKYPKRGRIKKLNS